MLCGEELEVPMRYGSAPRVPDAARFCPSQHLLTAADGSQHPRSRDANAAIASLTMYSRVSVPAAPAVAVAGVGGSDRCLWLDVVAHAVSPITSPNRMARPSPAGGTQPPELKTRIYGCDGIRACRIRLPGDYPPCPRQASQSGQSEVTAPVRR